MSKPPTRVRGQGAVAPGSAPRRRAPVSVRQHEQASSELHPQSVQQGGAAGSAQEGQEGFARARHQPR